MGKMPNAMKIWIGERSFITRDEKEPDVKKVAKVGDEGGVSTGQERQRMTYYTVTSVWSNCLEIKRQDVIKAEKEELAAEEAKDKKAATAGSHEKDHAPLEGSA